VATAVGMLDPPMARWMAGDCALAGVASGGGRSLSAAAGAHRRTASRTRSTGVRFRLECLLRRRPLAAACRGATLQGARPVAWYRPARRAGDCCGCVAVAWRVGSKAGDQLVEKCGSCVPSNSMKRKKPSTACLEQLANGKSREVTGGTAKLDEHWPRRQCFGRCCFHVLDF